MSPTGPDLHGRVCLVTGATSGIGRVTAEELAGMGATTLLVARDAERGERARATSSVVAPMPASSSAVTRPIPEVAPVTRQTLPCRSGPVALIGSRRASHASPRLPSPSGAARPTVPDPCPEGKYPL